MCVYISQLDWLGQDSQTRLWARHVQGKFLGVLSKYRARSMVNCKLFD